MAEGPMGDRGAPSAGARGTPPLFQGDAYAMSRLDRELNDALQRAQADDLGRPRSHFAREPEPLPPPPDWGPLRFLQPATPWHLVGIGVLLAIVGRLLGRVPLATPLIYLGILLLAIGLVSLILLPREQPKRWRGRLITLDDSWRARLYRRIYRR
jgi:hypothetical protein